MKTKAVIYCRFGPRLPGDELPDLDEQSQACREYCEQHGYAIVRELRDAVAEFGQAGPGAAEAIATIRRGWVLVITSPDIVGDTPLLDGYFYGHIARKKYGTRIETADGCGWTSPDGALARGIDCAYRQYRAARAGVLINNDIGGEMFSDFVGVRS